MFGKRKPPPLEPPPLARHPDAVEVLRVRARPGDVQQVSLKTTWEDPGAWGMLLADVAHHVANAYVDEGWERAGALARILELLDAELSNPTDEARRPR